MTTCEEAYAQCAAIRRDDHGQWGDRYTSDYVPTVAHWQGELNCGGYGYSGPADGQWGRASRRRLRCRCRVTGPTPDPLTASGVPTRGAPSSGCAGAREATTAQSTESRGERRGLRSIGPFVRCSSSSAVRKPRSIAVVGLTAASRRGTRRGTPRGSCRWRRGTGGRSRRRRSSRPRGRRSSQLCRQYETVSLN